MTQILNSLPSDRTQRILCSYFNPSPLVEVVCITNVFGWYFERVVFPYDRILFEAVPEAILQIHSTTPFGAIKVNPIPCRELRILEKGQTSSPALLES